MNFDNSPEIVDTSSNIKEYSLSLTYLPEADHNIQNIIALQDNSAPILLETDQSLNFLQDCGDKIVVIPKKASLNPDHLLLPDQNTPILQDGLLEPLTTFSAEKPGNKPLVTYSDNDSDYTDLDPFFGEPEKTTIVPDGLLEPYTTFGAEKPKQKPLVAYSDNDSDYTDSDDYLGEPEKKRQNGERDVK